MVEAFLLEPSLELNICACAQDIGPGSAFHRIYGEAIQRSGNIKAHGFIKPSSKEFAALAESCAHIVNVSASEGGAGATVQCLHFGLVPIVTESVGIVVSGQTDEEMSESIGSGCRYAAEVPDNELETKRRSAWEYARLNHTRAAYGCLLSVVLDEWLAP